MEVKYHTYKGFLLINDGGPDARWRAWRDDGVKLRADTLAGIKQFVTEYLEK